MRIWHEPGRMLGRIGQNGRGAFVGAVFLAAVVFGCGRNGGPDAALDSDANGYVCLDCKAKFYTDRKIFANHCPACRKANLEMVLGFVCAADQRVQYGPRRKGGMACEQCGKMTTGIAIPREAELKAWGATRRSGSEVGVE